MNKYASLEEIQDVVYLAAKSVFNGVINGDVYHDGTRPMDSNKEDVIVAVSAGTVSQIQDFSAYVNVYIPDIQNKTKRYVLDRGRIEEIIEYEDELVNAFNDNNIDLYEARISSATTTLVAREVKQHIVSFNLGIKCLTFNR